MTSPQNTKPTEAPRHCFSPIGSHRGWKAIQFEAVSLPWVSLNRGAVLRGYSLGLDVRQAFQVLFSPKIRQIIPFSLTTDPVPSHLLFVSSSVIKAQLAEPNLSEVYGNGSSWGAEPTMPPTWWREISTQGSHVDAILIIVSLKSNNRNFGFDWYFVCTFL